MIPAVSVIVPVYNTAPFLCECLESLCAQTLRELEIICIDDGSTDRSREILENFRSRDERIRVISQENAGQGAARNRGLEIARGEFIAFVDSDDFVVPEFAEKLYTKANAEKLEMLFLDFENCDEFGKKIENKNPNFANRVPVKFLEKSLVPADFSPNDFRKIPAFTWQCFYSRGFIERAELSFPENMFFEDRPFVIEAFFKANRIGILNEKIYNYRQRENSTMSNRGNAFDSFIRQGKLILQTLENLRVPADFVDAAIAENVLLLRNLAFCVPAKFPQIWRNNLQNYIAKMFPQNSRERRFALLSKFDRAILEFLLDSTNENARCKLEKFARKYAFFSWISFGSHKTRSREKFLTTKNLLEIFSTKNEAFVCKEIAQFSVPAAQKIFDEICSARERESQKDLYLVIPQLGTKTNEPIDPIVFFKFLLKKGLPAKFIVQKNHPVFEKLRSRGWGNNLIEFDGNGISDYELLEKIAPFLPKAKAIILENVLQNPFVNWLYDTKMPPIVFLQHGPTALKFSTYIENMFVRANLCNVAGTPEKDFLEKFVPGYFGSSRCILSGLPRWDLLAGTPKNANAQKIVFVMPTFREDFANDIERFKNSPYFLELKNLFSAENIERLKSAGTSFVFAPHHRILTILGELNFEFSPEIEIASTQEISHWVKKADCLVTDFSSVSFDFHFQNKPVIYWIHDSADKTYRKDTAMQIDFAREQIKNYQFVRAKTSNEVIEKILNYAARNFELEPENRGNAERFFVYKENICERFFEGMERELENQAKNPLKIAYGNAFSRERPRENPLKIFAIRLACFFIFNKKKRKRFREHHLDLSPRDGVDIHELSQIQTTSINKQS